MSFLLSRVLPRAGASALLKPRPLTLGLTLTCTTGGSLLMLLNSRPLQLDSFSSGASAPFSPSQAHQQPQPQQPQPQQPPSNRPGAASTVRSRILNARTLRQVSSGSILGLLGGLALSAFSKPLALLIGLLVFGVQYIESKGIHIVPYQRIQRVAKNIDVRAAMRSNVPFKLSFGATFALAALAEFQAS